eukprot:GEMP01067953.1.p1 GENE.GEMP01067953.1~~GEMP01067953.1.p1  ORF type:complete len:113 (-),score=1.49 GEMP01067953.1:408-746(-)
MAVSYEPHAARTSSSQQSTANRQQSAAHNQQPAGNNQRTAACSQQTAANIQQFLTVYSVLLHKYRNKVVKTTLIGNKTIAREKQTARAPLTKSESYKGRPTHHCSSRKLSYN